MWPHRGSQPPEGRGLNESECESQTTPPTPPPEASATSRDQEYWTAESDPGKKDLSSTLIIRTPSECRIETVRSVGPSQKNAEGSDAPHDTESGSRDEKPGD